MFALPFLRQQVFLIFCVLAWGFEQRLEDRLLVHGWQLYLVQTAVNDGMPSLVTVVSQVPIEDQGVGVGFEHFVHRHTGQVVQITEIKLVVFSRLHYVPEHSCNGLIEVSHGYSRGHGGGVALLRRLHGHQLAKGLHYVLVLEEHDGVRVFL